MNRERSASVYLRPDDVWGLDVWRRSAARRRRRAVACGTRRLLRNRARASRPLSRRAGRSSCSTCTRTTTGATDPRPRRRPADENPDVNVGTGTLDRTRFGAARRSLRREAARGARGRPPPRRARERPLSRRLLLPVGARAVPRDEDARWRSSSRRPSWTSGPASSTTTTWPSSARRCATRCRRCRRPWRSVRDGRDLDPDATDLAVDHELADIALSFDFLLDVSPVNGVQGTRGLPRRQLPRRPAFVYRELGDELADRTLRGCSAWTSPACETRRSRT